MTTNTSVLASILGLLKLGCYQTNQVITQIETKTSHKLGAKITPIDPITKTQYICGSMQKSPNLFHSFLKFKKEEVVFLLTPIDLSRN